MYERCGVLLGECAVDQREIESFVKNQPLEELTRTAQSFAVRSARIGVAKSIGRVNLERDIGAVVKESVPRLNVKLKNSGSNVCLHTRRAKIPLWPVGIQETLRPHGAKKAAETPRLPPLHNAAEDRCGAWSI